jgi:hypothetical protein
MAVISLTSDNLTPIRVGFSMKDPGSTIRTRIMAMIHKKQVKTMTPRKNILGFSHIKTWEPRQPPDSLLQTSKMIFVA